MKNRTLATAVVIALNEPTIDGFGKSRAERAGEERSDPAQVQQGHEPQQTGQVPVQSLLAETNRTAESL